MTLVPEVAPMSYQDAERLSTARIRKHFPELLIAPGPLDVVEVFELLQDEYGMAVSVSSSLPDGVEGRTWPSGLVELSETTYAGAVNNEPRPRFTVIHECNHAWHHAHQIKNVLESGTTLRLNRRSNIPSYRDPEWQANALTGAMLMPISALQILKDKRQLNVHAVQDTFNVSYQAAKTRLAVIQRKNFI